LAASTLALSADIKSIAGAPALPGGSVVISLPAILASISACSTSRYSSLYLVFGRVEHRVRQRIDQRTRQGELLGTHLRRRLAQERKVGLADLIGPQHRVHQDVPEVARYSAPASRGDCTGISHECKVNAIVYTGREAWLYPQTGLARRTRS